VPGGAVLANPSCGEGGRSGGRAVLAVGVPKVQRHQGALAPTTALIPRNALSPQLWIGRNRKRKAKGIGFALFARGFGENSPRAPYLPVVWENRPKSKTAAQAFETANQKYVEKRVRQLPNDALLIREAR
jgi:hypothetical protein